VGRVGSALGLSVALAAARLSAQDTTVGPVRAWRAQHEPQVLRELFDLLAIPNAASNAADIERNAQALTRMFEKRRFLPESIPTGGAPLVVAERLVSNARRTVTFYRHYDGQPVGPREWTHALPFSPVIVTDLAAGGRTMAALLTLR
jgi:acetylornithine deacetylase/succinyl-diaminopimelate desuccinylase-like protein